jgi:hypothetical protein
MKFYIGQKITLYIGIATTYEVFRYDCGNYHLWDNEKRRSEVLTEELIMRYVKY